MHICVIPARGGSKRIPRKNVRPFKGKPMIVWSIEAALASGCFDSVLVSTDDAAIAEIAESHGAEVPCLRPSALADDYTPANVAARHMLEWAIANRGPIASWAMVFPAAPFLRAETIRAGMALLHENAYEAVWAVTTIPYPVYQLLVRDEDGAVQPLFPHDKYMMRSQDMPAAFIDVGQLYCFETQAFLQRGMRVSDKLGTVEVPCGTALDIDTEEDFLFAEKMYDFLQLQNC